MKQSEYIVIRDPKTPSVDGRWYRREPERLEGDRMISVAEKYAQETPFARSEILHFLRGMKRLLENRGHWAPEVGAEEALEVAVAHSTTHASRALMDPHGLLSALGWTPPPEPPGFQRAVYEPTGEYETRADGAVAEVYRRRGD